MKICKRVSKRCSACPAGSLGSRLWCWKLILPSSAQGRYCWSTWISYHGFFMLCFTPGTASISFQTRHFLGAGVRPAFFSRAGCTELSCAELGAAAAVNAGEGEGVSAFALGSLWSRDGDGDGGMGMMGQGSPKASWGRG